ncbi:response regulator [Salibacteraceae bacterium]|jgi:YesN/AraC family two-component response regulator|nr:response regulator [Salibacteraceae bacterium]MDB9710160.1 response regulator [Salibacteraceae bacterium]
MKRISALIVDDEELARKNLEFLLKDDCPSVDVIGTADNAREAKKFVQANKIDLMFLDIEIPMVQDLNYWSRWKMKSTLKSFLLLRIMNMLSKHLNIQRLTIC